MSEPRTPVDPLLRNNRAWSERIRSQDPDFFRRLSEQQAPGYLWIGCSDSRVPANEIVGLQPGELFVHRNVANLVVHSDLNCLSALQYAVDILGVEHVIVCGHYGCGGVTAAFRNDRVGLAENWLRHIQDLRNDHEDLLAGARDASEAIETLCELNVIEQVVNTARTTVVQDAWSRGQGLGLHGWIYRLEDGILQDLGLDLTGPLDLAEARRRVLDQIAVRRPERR